MVASSGSGRLSFGPELENSVLPLTGVVELAADRAGRLVEVDALHVVVVDLVHELRVREVGLRRAAAGEAAHDERGGDEREHDPRHPAQRRRGAAARRWRGPLGGRALAGGSVVRGPGGRARVGAPRRWRSGRTTVGRAERLRLAGVGFDPGLEIGLAAAHPRAGSSSWFAPCYGPAARPTERELGTTRGLGQGCNTRDPHPIPRDGPPVVPGDGFGHGVRRNRPSAPFGPGSVARL